MLEQYLEDLRHSCEERHIPLISRETQAFLENRLNKNHPKRVIEIGAAVGFSGIIIAKTIQQRGGALTTFEISYPAYLEAMKNLQIADCENVVLYPFDINKLSLEKFFSQKFDAAFIDAQKSQYGDYLQKIRQYLNPENTLLLDDVIKYQNKLGGLYGFIKEKQIKYQNFSTEPGDGVMLINNKNAEV